MEPLYEDGVALIEHLGCAACAFLGLSMGGFIGLRLAARHPELLRSLILLETSADPEPSEHVAKYKQLTFVARWFGLGLVVDRVTCPIFIGHGTQDELVPFAMAERLAQAARPRRPVTFLPIEGGSHNGIIETSR